jgi:hypothetical protein
MHALDRSDHTPVIVEHHLRWVMAPCILLALPNPILFMVGAPGTGKLTGDQPRWNAPGRDYSAIWLRNAAVGLCLLAAAAAVVSFTAQYRLIQATRRLAVVAGLEAAIPRCCRPGLRLPRDRAGLARQAGDPGPGPEPDRGRDQRVHERHRGRSGLAEPGHLGHAPVAYALASDTLIGVVRSWALARHQHLGSLLAGDQATPLAILGGLILWLLRLTLAPASTLAGFRAWVLAECPVGPGRIPAPGGPLAAHGQGPARDEDGPLPFFGGRTERPTCLHPP